MDLQQKQLQQLSDWLSQTEERIMKIETEPPAKDMDVYQERIEQHKVNSPSAAALFTPHSLSLRRGNVAATLLCRLCRRVNTSPCELSSVCLLPLQELQNDLEAEQVKVNSLTHMVVVVDENSGESATAALEEQLQVSLILLKGL